MCELEWRKVINKNNSELVLDVEYRPESLLFFLSEVEVSLNHFPDVFGLFVRQTRQIQFTLHGAEMTEYTQNIQVKLLLLFYLVTWTALINSCTCFYSENQWVRVSVPDNKTRMQQQTHNNVISQLQSL